MLKEDRNDIMRDGFETMKNTKNVYSSLFFLAILFLAILLLLFGSFFDLSIAKGMFGKMGEASKFLSIIVPLPGYVLFALSGAMVVSSFSLANKTKIQKILIETPIFLMSVASGLLYGYFSLSHLLSLPLAFLTGLFVMGLFEALWLWMENKNGKRDLTKEAFAIISSFLVVLLVVWILNEELLRYSYKAIRMEEGKDSLFSAWWAFQGKDPEILKDNTINLSLLQGGPSLDVALSAFTLFLPFVLPKGSKEKTWISGLIIAFFVLLGIFVELSAGQYFLSAIAWGLGLGATISGLILFFVEYPSFKATKQKPKRNKKAYLFKGTKEAASKALRIQKANAARLKRNRKRSRNRKRQIIILKSLSNEEGSPSKERETQ